MFERTDCGLNSKQCQFHPRSCLRRNVTTRPIRRKTILSPVSLKVMGALDLLKRRRRPAMERSPATGARLKSQCHKSGEPDRFAREFTKSKNVSYCNSIAFVCSLSLMVGPDSPLEWVVDSGA